MSRFLAGRGNAQSKQELQVSLYTKCVGRRAYMIGSVEVYPRGVLSRCLGGCGDVQSEQERQVRMGDSAGGAAPGLQAVKGAGGDVDHETAAAIAAHNGEGDSVGVRSGVLQVCHIARLAPHHVASLQAGSTECGTSTGWRHTIWHPSRQHH